MINVTGDVLLTLTPVKQAATIDTGAMLELAGADSSSVTFEGATGMLILDHSSEFAGQIIGFTGNGNVSSSDVLDLRDIAYRSGTIDSHSGNTSGGTLAVSDTAGEVASISLAGDYENSTFSLSSDGNGGTLVIDPSVTNDNFSFKDPNSPANLARVVSFAFDAANTANGQASLGWRDVLATLPKMPPDQPMWLTRMAPTMQRHHRFRSADLVTTPSYSSRTSTTKLSTFI